MEDFSAYDRRPWHLTDFGHVARQVGHFNGVFLSGQPVPSETWLSRGWLRGWREQAGPVIGLVPTVADRWPISQMIRQDMINDLIGMWEKRGTVYESLEGLPQTLCHNDVFPRNIFIRADRWRRYQLGFLRNRAGGTRAKRADRLQPGFLESRPATWDDLERELMAAEQQTHE